MPNRAESAFRCISLTHTSEGREGIFASSAFPIGVYLGKGGGRRGGGVFNLLFSSPVPRSLPPLLLALGRRTEKERKRGTFSPPPLSSTYPSSPRGRKRKRKKPASHGIRTMRGENGGITRGKKEGASLLSQQSQRKGVPTSQARREGGGEVKGKKEGSNRAACNKNTSLCPPPSPPLPPPNPIYNIYLAVQFCSTPFLSFPLSSLSFSFYHSPLFFPLGALFSLRSLKKASSKKPQKLLLLSPTPVATFK